MTIQLATTLTRLGLRQSDLARDLGVGRSSVCALVNHGRTNTRLSDAAVRDWLAARGATPAECDHWAWPVAADATSTALLSAGASIADASEDTEMLLQAQRLTADERAALGLARDPFHDEISSHADIYLPHKHRAVRETMWQCCQHRGFLAVVGESGSGKTILRRDVLNRALVEDPTVVPIQPYVLGMEQSDRRGLSLRATDIAEIIIRRLEPSAPLRSSRQGRYGQAEDVLAARVKMGHKPVLIIEEAHSLPPATLRHLKRFAELEIGYTKMLGIILLGQSELGDILSESDPSVREVVQRCEVIRLPPLDDQVGPYLRHKLARAGADLDQLVDPDALDAIRSRLEVRGRGAAAGQVVSLCYPLAVQNLLVIALRAALQVGRFTRLTREHVEAV